MCFTDLSAYCVLWVTLIWVFGRICVDQHDTRQSWAEPKCRQIRLRIFQSLFARSAFLGFGGIFAFLRCRVTSPMPSLNYPQNNQEYRTQTGIFLTDVLFTALIQARHNSSSFGKLCKLIFWSFLFSAWLLHLKATQWGISCNRVTSSAQSALRTFQDGGRGKLEPGEGPFFGRG